MARTYLVSVSVLAGIGWLQLTIWAQTGSDPLPVGFVNSLLGGAGEERSGITTFYDESIYRMSSFGGEPKGLGSSLAVALLLLQSGFNVWRQRLILWAFLFCSLIATLSTMGIMIWFAGTAIQMIAPAPLSARIPKISLRLRRSVFVLGTLLVLSIGWGLLSTEKGAWLVELIEFRTVTRISERAESGGSWVSGAMEDFNVAVYGFLADKPVHSIFGVGVGNAHLYANSYLPDYAKAHAEGTAFVAKSSLLRWTSELGIVSFLAFLIWLLLLARNLIRAFRPIGLGDSARGAIGRFFIPVTLIWLASGYITPQFYLMLGTIIGLIYVAEATEQRTTFSSPVGPSIRPTKA
jgi:hypothetical protein